MQTYFISDLHLCAARYPITELFLKFLQTKMQSADALYILGDFFEAWIGDDLLAENKHDRLVVNALANLSQRIPIYFMHGNRDFLIGEAFAKKTGCRLLPDPFVIEIYGKRLLLTHGDLLCTLDTSYQKFRRFVRNPFIKSLFLNLPIFIRRRIAKKLRAKSREAGYKAKSAQDLARFDVTETAVNKMLIDHKAHIMIHGHTHKPGIQDFLLEGKPARRITLGDWDLHGSALIMTSSDMRLEQIL